MTPTRFPEGWEITLSQPRRLLSVLFEPWAPHSRSLGLYAICYRVASDRRRRAYERREVVQAAPNVAEVADPAPPIEFDRRRALLQAALSTLPLEQRAVFTLFELEGLRGDEIAAMLGIPVPTVHSRLRLAREGFRRALLRAAAQDQARLRRTGVIP